MKTNGNCFSRQCIIFPLHHIIIGLFDSSKNRCMATGQLGSKLALYSEGRNGRTSIYNLYRGMGDYVKNHCFN